MDKNTDVVPGGSKYQQQDLQQYVAKPHRIRIMLLARAPDSIFRAGCPALTCYTNRLAKSIKLVSVEPDTYHSC